MSRLALGALAVVVGLALLAASAQAVVEQPFAVRYSANDTGAIWVTGNTLMTCPVVDLACAGAQAGTVTGAALNNNAYAMARVDVDGDPGTFDSSSSTFAPPAGSTVLFAGLYWGGRTTAGTGGAAAPAAGARGSVAIRAPGGGYVPLSGTVADSRAVPGAYTGFADVTSFVAAGGPGVYTVGNVQAGTGLDRYAGWGLVVVYRSDTQPLRNLTVFDGLAAIQQGDPPLSLTVSGFTTPRTGAVRTSVGLVAYEGDRGSAGDRLQLNGTALSDAANPANNLFNSSISAEGVDATSARSPGYVNQLGFDADRIVTSGLIANGATSANLLLSTTLDQYLTQMVSLATDLSAPSLTAVKGVANLTRGGDGSLAQPGDVLRYTVTVTNSGDDAADDVVVTDPAPAGTALAGGSAACPCSIGSLAPGASASVSFDAVVSAGAGDGFAIVNSAAVAGRGATAGLPVSALTGEVRTVVQVPVAPAPPVPPVPPAPVPPVVEPPISVESTVEPSPPVAGEPAAIRTVLENTTAAPIEDVVVTITVPGATLLSARVGEGSCDEPRGSTVTCRVGTLAPGQRVAVTVRAEPLHAGAVLRPVVTVRGAGIPTRRVVVRGLARVARPAALRVTKTAAVRRARPSQVVAYRIVVRSVGGVAARGVRVCDEAGRGLRLLSAPGAQSRSAARACWTVRGALAPGRARVFGVTARVSAALTRSVTVVNGARASAVGLASGAQARRARVSRALVQVAPLPDVACGVAASAAVAGGAGGPGAGGAAARGGAARGAAGPGPRARAAC